MNQLVLTSKIVEKISALNAMQQTDVLSYVDNFSGRAKNDAYRKKAIREIRTALQHTRDF